MPRKNIYFQDTIYNEIKSWLEIEEQKGASGGEVSFSSEVNELCRLGLMVKKSRNDTNSFDLEGFRRDLIKKVSGTREGMMILMTMITELYLNMRGPDAMKDIEAVLSQNFEAINSAEDEAESTHFVSEKE